MVKKKWWKMKKRKTKSFWKKTKKKGSWGKKPKKKPKSDYSKKYNIYSYDSQGRAKKIKTFRDNKEAKSWVSNMKARSPNAQYKIVSDVKKKGW